MATTHLERPVTGPPASVTRTSRSLWLTGLLVVAVATVFRVWVLRPGWFFFDDLYFIEKAREDGLSAGYLFQSYNGHLVPASWLLCWVNAKAGAFDFVYPATEMVVMFAVFGVGLLRLLLTLFGPRRGILFPLVLALFSPLLLPATVWWAAAVNQLPMLIALVFGLDAFVRHLRDGRTRHLVASIGWLLLGLAFVERTLVVAGVMWLVALLYFTSGPVPGRVVQLWRAHRAAVLSHGVLVVAYVAVYLKVGSNFAAQSVATRPFFGVLKYLVGISFPTGVTGGPLRWRLAGVTQNEPHPQQLVLILSWVILGVLVWASVRTRRRGVRAWLLPLSALTFNALLTAISRALYFGPEIALDPRFQTEVGVLMPLAVGLAFLPVIGAVESSEPRESGWRVDTPATVLPAALVFLLASAVSSSSFPLRELGSVSPERYVETFAASARAHRGAEVLDRPVPSFLWSPVAYPTNLTSRLLAPVAGPVDLRSSPTDDALRIDASGHLVPIHTTQSRSQTAPVRGNGCFATLRGTRGTWSLDGPVLGLDWYLRLDYRATAPTTLTTVVGDEEHRVGLLAGEHHVLAPAGGSYATVGLGTAGGSAPVCLEHLAIVSIDGL